jgi:hypothetical protein
VSGALVGDVAYVVGIETLRSAPLIIDWSRKAKPSLDRTFSLRPGIIESSPGKILPWKGVHAALLTTKTASTAVL